MNKKVQVRFRIFLIAFALSILFCPPIADSKEIFPYRAAVLLPSFQSPSLAAPVSSRPRMVLISRLGVYYAPDVAYNIYLLNKIWFLYYDGKWYKSRAHDGPWRYVSFSQVPEKLKNLPEAYIKKENAPLPKKVKPAKKKHSKKKGRNSKKISFLSDSLFFM